MYLPPARCQHAAKVLCNKIRDGKPWLLLHRTIPHVLAAGGCTQMELKYILLSEANTKNKQTDKRFI